jgi:opacity protein-like surface antigen
MRYFRCFLLVALVAIAGKANAQDFTVFGGFHHPGAINLLPSVGGVTGAAGQLLTEPKTFGVFGARLYRSGAPLGLEHTIAFSPNFVESDANALIYNTNLRVELPAPMIRPYVTAGIGLVRAGGNGPGAFGTKFSFNYGGGVKASVFGPAGVRLDVRGYSIRGVGEQTFRVLEASVGIFFSY